MDKYLACACGSLIPSLPPSSLPITCLPLPCTKVLIFFSFSKL